MGCPTQSRPSHMPPPSWSYAAINFSNFREPAGFLCRKYVQLLLCLGFCDGGNKVFKVKEFSWFSTYFFAILGYFQVLEHNYQILVFFPISGRRGNPVFTTISHLSSLNLTKSHHISQNHTKSYISQNLTVSHRILPYLTKLAQNT